MGVGRYESVKRFDTNTRAVLVFLYDVKGFFIAYYEVLCLFLIPEIPIK